jgi:hypothetical protein
MKAGRKVPSAPLIVGVLLSACQSNALPQGQPARLRSVNDAVQRELTQALTELTGASRLMVDAEQLTQSPILTLERVGRQDANGVVMQGADRELPPTFELRWSGGQCVIVQLKTGKSRLLMQADCQPVF